jgi:hypothetical protein
MGDGRFDGGAGLPHQGLTGFSVAGFAQAYVESCDLARQVGA